MKYAVPMSGGILHPHFGHCEHFAIIDADSDTKNIKSQELVDPPAHEPGVLPKWLSGLHVNLVIAGGMGQRAQQLFAQNQIEVVVGAPAESAEDVVSAYLEGRMECGDNVCDH